ncbi:SOS response-associated peptidase [Epidermidibacterium keratini]|uniref:Abasic site processing protein n=1 Tax=Epidermidibacterium keratini TaxID=1891644 RepID=A0A7L4YRB0_9ACTN|nr:SOS response-associated peptidase [Epidermidibacterium keratini]QHC01660.1 SOS response-associated peptidase [Epidermidibacterium keratini]
MCGRYTSKKNPVELAEEFDAEDRIAEQRRPDFNVAPTRNEPVVRAERDQHGPQAARELVEMRWGLVPFWAKDPKAGGRMFNARAETLTTKPAFRSAVKKRRVLVPADGWYEWKKSEDGKTKQPYYMTTQDGSSLAFAGLWESWGTGEDYLQTYTIITTEAQGQLTEVHDRMPFLLPASAWGDWLDPDRDDVTDLLATPDLERGEQLELRPVGADVGKVANNSPELIERIEPGAVLL